MSELLVLGLFGVACAYQFLATVRARLFSQRTCQKVGSRVRFSQIKPLHRVADSSLLCIEGFLDAEDPVGIGDHDFYICSAEDPPAKWLRRNDRVTWLKVRSEDDQNGKAACLASAQRYWSGEIFVVSDADMVCSSDYLKAVLGEFSDPQVGAVTCLYRARPSGLALGSIFESLSILDFSSSVLVAEWTEGIAFAMGSTMAIRREVLEEIGGFEALVPYLADDFQLGKRVADAGHRVALAPTVLDTDLGDPTFTEALSHQYRWMVTSRVSRPAGHAAFIVTQGMVWALLICLFDLDLGVTLVGLWCGLRVGLGYLQSRALQGVESGRDMVEPLILPLKDLVFPLLWMASLFGRRVRWGARELSIDGQGRIEPSVG